MSRLGVIAVLAALPSSAFAGQALDVEIVSPLAGVCVNNGPEVFTGGVPGGEALPNPIDVPFELSVTVPDDAPVTLSFYVDGAVDPVHQEEYRPEAGGQALIQAAIPSFLVQDGEDKAFRVVVSSEGGAQAEDTVTFDLDREPPRLIFDPEALDALAECHDEPPQIPYEIEDNLDPAPTSESRRETNGCLESRIVTVRDHCGAGNAQEVDITTLSAPDPGDLSVTVQGYRCEFDRCVTEGEEADPFADGDRVGRATVDFDVEAPEGCAPSLNATATVDGGEPQVLIPGAVLEQPGEYVVTVTAASCNGLVEDTAELRFTVLEAPVADAGGPYVVQEGEALMLDASGSEADQAFGGIAELAWDLDGDRFFEIAGPPEETMMVPFDTSEDGTYTVRVRITAGNGGFEVDEAEITVTDVDPTCDAGGPYQGVEGQAVQLDGSGSAAGSAADPILVYNWDFGDNVFPQRGIESRPSHIYGDAGEYTVTLRVEDEDSASECEAQVVIGDSGPIIEGLAALDADALVQGDNVCFTAGDTRAANAFDPIIDFRWEWGDNTPNSNGPALRNPCHTFAQDGTYEVCLQVQDEEDTVRECIEVVVGDVEPICTFAGPLFLNEGSEAFFDAGESAGGAPDEPLVELVWNFGDGTDEVTRGADSRDVTHTFPEQGEFTVMLTVRDQDSEVSCTHDIIVNDVVPTASLVVVYPQGQADGREGEALSLDASGSRPGADSDPIVAYRWDFGDGTTEETEDPIVQHAWQDQGVYPVRVTVVDEDGSAVGAQSTVTVVNVPPRLSIEAAEGDQAEIGVEAQFVLNVDDVAGDLPPPTIRWDMGDGTTYEGLQQVSHTYNQLGEQVIRVTADDGDGGVGQAELRIEVTPAAPRLQRIDPIETCEGETVSFRMQVDAALRDEGETYDGPVQIGVRAPATAPAPEIVDDPENPMRTRFVDFEWTPTFYDAGQHVVRVTGVGPFTGISRVRDVVINVCEAGSPVLAAAGGTASRGLLTIYDYSRQNDRIRFDPRVEVNVGLGAADMVIGPDGQRAYGTFESNMPILNVLLG